MFYDATYVLVLIGALLSMMASARVKGAFNRYSKVRNSRGYTAEQVAQRMLHEAGIYDVTVERIRGQLTDHYSPKEKVLRLSEPVYGNSSVAAIGVAAHECGHAIQHQENYWALGIRSMSVPVANIGSKLSWPLIILGLILGYTGLAQVGVFLFLFVVLFQLITLPVEFNASGRALAILRTNGLLEGDELKGAKKVLTAAALTYVAALMTTILQFLRLFMMVNSRKGRR